MTEPLKGIQGLYESCCSDFYEWCDSTDDSPAEGHLCSAPIWYNDAEALTLIEDNYNPWKEEESTWKLTSFSTGKRDARLPHRPYKTFGLESDDDLIVVKCKIRPVLAIRKVSSDWRVPGNATKLYDTWLCLPLFRYKRRHTQEYVLRDQRLDRPHHFYFPVGASDASMNEEAAGKFTQMQFISERNLTPFKSYCSEKNMFRPLKLTDDAFFAVLGHMGTFLPKIDVDEETRKWYSGFSSLVVDEINKRFAL